MKVSIHIHPDSQGGYTAMCLSLPGCATRAATREQARKDLEDAIAGYLAAVNNFVPENLAQELVEV